MQKKKIFVLCGNFFIFAGLNKKTDVLYSCTIVLCSNICELEQDTDKKRNSDCFFGLHSFSLCIDADRKPDITYEISVL